MTSGGVHPAAEEALLERGGQLAALQCHIAEAAGGSGRLVLIDGEAGIGKTRLLAAASERARDGGLIVLSARGGERERDFAFGIVRQLLEPALRSATPPERAQLMAGAARFCEDVFGVPAADAQRSSDPSFAVLHGLYWLMANLAERTPVMLAIDDAHWADRPSLRFIAFLARRLEGLRVLIALASRRDELGAEADLLRELCHELDTRPIEPQLLSEEAVARLARCRLGDAASDELCAACHETTRGNPFLLSELLLELSDSEADSLGPAAVRQLAPRGVATAVLVRLDRLPQPTTTLARAVCVLGDRAAISDAAALADLERDRAGAAADLLADAAILERARPLRFLHPIVRSAVYDVIPPAQRALLHARAARLLAQQSVDPQVIAQQLMAADPAADPWVVQTLRDAARAALALGAPEIAASYLRRAVAEPPVERAQVLVELGSAEARAGEPSARENLAAARALATDPWCVVLATIELVQVLAYQGKAGDAAVIALETLEAIREEPNAVKAVKMLLLVLSQIDLRARQMTTEVVQRAAQIVERLGPSAPKPVLAIIAGDRATGGGTAQEVADLAERAVEGEHTIDEDTAPHAHYVSVALTLVDRGDIAEGELTRAIDDAARRGSARGFGAATAVRAWCRYRAGALAGAEADARAFLDMTGDPRQHLFRPLASSALADVLVERGDLEGAWTALTDDVGGPHTAETLHAQPLRESRARLLMAQGRPREALGVLATYARWEKQWGASNGVLVQWRSAAALAHHVLNEAGDARRLIDEELELTRRFGAARATGITMSAAGVIDGGGHGTELLREAVQLLERSDARLEHARALVRLGALTRRQGQPVAARDVLRSGLDLATRLGATALSETARQELLAAGARPRRPALTGRDALTPSERRVAEPAAAGRSNREIAQSLFLTVRTIEMHLSNAYYKLGIRSREQLQHALYAD